MPILSLLKERLFAAGGFSEPSLFLMESGLLSIFILLSRKTFTAENRTAAARLKGNAAGLSALGADGLVLHPP